MDGLWMHSITTFKSAASHGERRQQWPRTVVDGRVPRRRFQSLQQRLLHSSPAVQEHIDPGLTRPHFSQCFLFFCSKLGQNCEAAGLSGSSCFPLTMSQVGISHLHHFSSRDEQREGKKKKGKLTVQTQRSVQARDS